MIIGLAFDSPLHYNRHMKTRNVLEDVPKVAFAPIHDGKWEFTPYPSCLKAVANYLGDGLAYHYLLGASGGAYRLVWHADRWEGGNVDLIFMAEDPLEPFRRALDASGYGYEILLNDTRPWDIFPAVCRDTYLSKVFCGDEAPYREKLISSIDEGRPAIGFGIVGPPEACIITGYDEEGEIITGWSMFQEHLNPEHNIDEDDDMYPAAGFEESGYFRQKDWFAKMTGLIILGDKKPVDTGTIYKNTLEWIPTILKTPRVHSFYTGQKAYEVYLEEMLDDGNFEDSPMEALAERKMVHYDAMTMISERGNGGMFLEDAAKSAVLAPAQQLVEKAAAAFKESGRQMEGWWQVVGQIWSDEEAQIKATADPKVRRDFAEYIRKSKSYDLEAAGLIEEALERLAT